MKANSNSSLIVCLCRWSARILGVLLLAVMVALAIGEGMPNVFTQPAKVQIGFIALGLLLLGILAGWRWELLGGIISLAGWATFVTVEVGPLRRLNLFILMLALPGTLYLASALLRRLKI